MLASTESPDLHDRQLRDWMLCLLRFAITQAPEDQARALALAAELDMQGGPGTLTFFQRTSVAVYHAIVVRDETGKRILKQYISRIEEPRLRNAFAAATGIEAFVSGHPRKKANDRFRSPLQRKGLRNP